MQHVDNFTQKTNVTLWYLKEQIYNFCARTLHRVEDMGTIACLCYHAQIKLVITDVIHALLALLILRFSKAIK